MLTRKQRRITISALSLIVLLGAAVRLYGLADRTITHPEVYVPGIGLPVGLSVPWPRMTLEQTLASMVAEKEPHPPAYYAFMLGWTRLVGSGIVALRLPSVLFGVVSIVLVYVLGDLEQDRGAALFAAGMLAFNGHHVLWSQLARMYIVACFLGLLATVLLVLVSKDGTQRRAMPFLYLGVTLVGLATSHYYWPILATHAVWALRSNWVSRTTLHLLRLQCAAAILGSPLLALAIFQSGRPSYLGTNLLTAVGRFLQFGFLFEPGYYAGPPGLLRVLAATILLLFALILLRSGLVSYRGHKAEHAPQAGLGWGTMGVASVLAVLLILALAQYTYAYDAGQTSLVIASCVFPVLLFVVDCLVRRYWESIPELGSWLSRRTTVSVLLVLSGIGLVAVGLAADLVGIGDQASLGPRQVSMAWMGLVLTLMGILVLVLGMPRIRIPHALSALLAILPITIVTGISPVIPLFASRGVMLYSPYLLLVLSRGLMALVHRARYWIALAVVLAAIHPLSVLHFGRTYHEHVVDYKGLSEQWVPEIRDSDLVFVEVHWATTPIFYYLKADRYHVVGHDYAQAVADYPGSRIWVLSFEPHSLPKAVEDTLAEYRVLQTINARGIRATLYGGQQPVSEG